MKAREVRELIGKDTDPRVVRVLEGLAESQNVLGQQLAALTEVVDGMIDVVASTQTVAVNMKNLLERVDKRGTQGDGPESSTI